MIETKGKEGMQTTKSTEGQGLPVLVRHNAQDFDMRYLVDPRPLYIEEHNAQHADDGFVASIPRATKPQTASRWWFAIACAAVAMLTWLIAHRLLG